MNYFYSEPNFFYKTILLKDKQFVAVDEVFENEEKLQEYLSKEKKSMLDSVIQGNIDDVFKIRVFDKDMGFQFFFPDDKQKEEKGYFQFSSEEKFNEALNFFLADKKARRSIEKKSQIAANIKTLMAPIIALIFTISLFLAAQQENLRISGSRRGLKTILANIAMTLGPTGSLIAGGIVTIILAFFAYKKLKESAREVVTYIVDK